MSSTSSRTAWESPPTDDGGPVRGSGEQESRTRLLDEGAIETVIGLAPNFFYGTGIPACILVLRTPRTRGSLRPQPSTAFSDTPNTSAMCSRSRPATSAATARNRSASCADGDRCRASPTRSFTPHQRPRTRSASDQ
ncbi:SAM-dependent methyltransferase [Streptomyces sp. NBC_00893]|nr:N-6 DNA methylase [Streptomyces sp. NBC_00893]MCX4847887.1 SAM-dependent methyltransferase [Streptomyces sp. NBC_00893]